MEYDRPTQAFLNQFPDPIRREAERLRQAGAVKQIFGGAAFIQARVEDGSDVYRVTFRREANGWGVELRGPESDSPAIVCAAMLERIERGDNLPDSPNEVENITLTLLLEEKLGRELTPEEDVFVDKLERRYRKYMLEDHIVDHDLVRLNSKWQVEGYDPLQIWPVAPGNIVEFWNYIAAAFAKKKLTWPPFMDALTDKEGTKEKLASWESEREAEAWQNKIDSVLTLPEAATDAVSFRLMVTMREARLQASFSAEDGTWRNVANEAEVLRLQTNLEAGLLRSDPVSQLLLMQWSAHWHDGGAAPSLRLDEPIACQLLGKFFRQPVLDSVIVNLDERPFYREPGTLRWSCEETADAGEAAPLVLHLVMESGEELPYSLTLLPGMEPMYLADEAVFRGPPALADGMEVQPRCEIPRHVVATEQGLEFLKRLEVEPPSYLKAMAVDVILKPKISLRLVKRGTAAESEIVQADVTAADEAGTRQEILEKDKWRVVERSKPEPGKLPVVDRAPLRGMPKQLESLGLVWDNPQKCFRGRLTKTFPDKFVAWMNSLPPDHEVELDSGLQSLRADPVQASVRFELAEAEEIDWFDLKILVDVKGLNLSKKELDDLVSARGGFVRLPDGKWVRLALSLTDEQADAISRLGLDVYDLTGERHRMHVLQLADPGVKEIFDTRAWERICQRADSLKLQIHPEVPAELALTLRPYQIEGFHFLAYLSVNKFGGLLADDMGLGKTAQSLCWLLWLRQRWKDNNPDKHIPPALVVAPKSVLDVWANEVKKFAPHLRTQVIRNKDELDIERAGKEIDVLVLNYSQLRVNTEKLKSVQWLTSILDEGQQIKNPDSQAARAARDLKADHRLVLSGTPIENRLLDIWSLMSFAMPGVLGNRKYFRDRFDRRKDAEAHTRLSARLRPFILRRTKGQVALDLPPRTEEEVYCEMDEAQEQMYHAELARMQRILSGMESDSELRKNSFVILQGLMRLRQICCHPALIDPAVDDSQSAKMTALFYLLDQLRDEGHKVLVFSQFVSMLEIIQKRLDEEKRPYMLLTGQSKDRGAIVEKFQTSKDPATFLLSLKAGGSGLNLTAASYVILYDPWWNPAVEAQAIDRTHRIGQTNPVIAYRLLVRNSVEEKIRKLQLQKQMLVTGVLGEESFSSNLKLDDLAYLFSRDGA